MLASLQEWMAQMLRLPIQEHSQSPLLLNTRNWIKPSPSLSPEKRIGIYNAQVWYRFFNLLQKDFPSLIRLFGDYDFNFLIAQPYLQAHWPLDSALILLGSKLPAYLTTHYHEEDRRLVLPLAFLDRAYLQIPNQASLPPLQNEHGPICLQPTLALLEMQADLFSFRKELLKHPAETWLERDFPPISWGPTQYYLLSHQNESFYTEELPLPAFRLLSAFQEKASLKDALGSLSPKECAAAEPHIFSWFQHWRSQGWLGAPV